MKDIEQRLDKAAADVKAGLRRQANSGAIRVPRRGFSLLGAVSAAILLLVVVGVATFAVTSEPSSVPGAPVDGRNTTEASILADGIVTQEEYRTAVQAVIDCSREAGLDVAADFNSPNGHASFQGPKSFGDPDKQFDQCLAVYLPNNVSLGWSVTLGDLDLTQMRIDTVARLTCIENRTGESFGELDYDEFGYPTAISEATMAAALDYKDHGPWNACSRQLFPDLWSDVEQPASPSEARWEIMTRNGMKLSIGSRSAGGCLEIIDDALAQGVCGADTTIPLSFSTGALYGKGFVAGWAPANAARVVFTLADGSVVETTDLGRTEEYAVRFFLEPVPFDERFGSDFPVTAVALDSAGTEIARLVVTSGANP
jgi:hypothetical protein